MAQIRAISMPKRIAAAAALVLSTAALLPVTVAHAETPKAAGPAVITEDLGSATATLTVELDDGTAVSADDLAKLGDLGEAVSTPAPADTLDAETTAVLTADTVNEAAPDTATDPASAAQPMAATSTVRAIFKCYDNKVYADARGAFSARHNCAFNNVNWGYRISPAVQAIISSPVREDGLHWWKNGAAQTKNSPHLVAKDYNFHGTMGPSDTGTRSTTRTP